MPTTQTIEIPLTRPPFAIDEYRGRQDSVLARVGAEELDVLLVTGNSHQGTLGGYDGSGSYFGRSPASSRRGIS